MAVVPVEADFSAGLSTEVSFAPRIKVDATMAITKPKNPSQLTRTFMSEKLREPFPVFSSFATATSYPVVIGDMIVSRPCVAVSGIMSHMLAPGYETKAILDAILIHRP